MIKNLGILCRYVSYWYLLFIAARIVFITLNWSQLHMLSIGELAYSFYHGFALDVSMTAYCCFIPFLLWIISHFSRYQVHINKALKIYNIVLLVIIVFITIADGELYIHWGQKINAYASSFAKFPKEMLVFSSGVGAGKLVVISVFYFVFAYYIYHFGMRGLDTIDAKLTSKWIIVSGVCIFILLVIGMRGGIGKSPLSQSSAYYSTHSILNQVALNTCWNLLSSFIETSESTSSNPYIFTSKQAAQQHLDLLQFKPKGFPLLFTSNQPNIVFIILEGWSADVVGCLGGEKRITPNFDSLSKEGYLFDHFYASGNRTDKGLAAIISAQPALPNSSIINSIQKFTKLPSVANSLKQHGYSTSFYYGGESDFANMKGYWLSAGYEHIVDLDDFPLANRNAEWGVHDDQLWQKVVAGLNVSPEPFFASVLTLSSHEPFNVPEKTYLYSADEADQYRNAVWYADKQLGLFFEQAKTQPWYSRTIFIIQSDHGHKLPAYHQPMQAGMYHIPMLVVGGALKAEVRGSVNHTLSSQLNTAATFLPQVHIDASAFNWSYNCLDSAYKPFAAFVYHHGVGLMNSDAKVVYSHFNKMVEWSEGDSLYFPLLEKQARSYLQVYYDEYLNR